MKNALLLSVLFITIAANGQTFDFYNKKLTVDTNGVIENKSFTFTLTNLNTFKYNVLLNNTPVNNNIDMPDIFKKYLKVSEIEKDTRINKGIEDFRSSKIKWIDDLDSLYVELKMSEQFYYTLIELVSSDLSPESMTDYKKGYYKQFMNSDPQEDEAAVAYIMKYYSKIISDILMYAPIVKAKLLINEEKQAIDTMVSYANNIQVSKIPEKLASLYFKINEQTFTVNSFIPRPNADDLTITITAKPNPAYNKNSDVTKINIPFLVKGGWKIDFSTGLFLSNIVDKEYVNKPDYASDSIIGYHLIHKDKNPLSYGIAGYMHAYWRNASNFNIGIAFGLGVDQNTQLKIMPGISIILGRKERFIVNGGLVIGKSKELLNIQDENHLYKDITEPNYSEQYNIGWFVGVSYNLTK